MPTRSVPTVDTAFVTLRNIGSTTRTFARLTRLSSSYAYSPLAQRRMYRGATTMRYVRAASSLSRRLQAQRLANRGRALLAQLRGEAGNREPTSGLEPLTYRLFTSALSYSLWVFLSVPHTAYLSHPRLFRASLYSPSFARVTVKSPRQVSLPLLRLHRLPTSRAFYLAG